MDRTLTDLIHNNTNVSGITAATYISLYGIRNKYNIPVSKFGDFIDGYCKVAYDDEQEDEGDGIAPKQLHLAEFIDNKSTIPLIGNFIFKFQVEEGEEDRSYYTEDLILKLVKCYQQTITQLLDVSENMSEYICCVQEGHSYRKGDYVKLNVMIQFPFCQVDTKFIKKTFRSQIEKNLRSNRVIESFDTPVVGDWNEIIVDFDTYVPMYRSTAEAGAPHLSLTHIYGMVEDDHIKEMAGPELELREVFNPSAHSFIFNGKVPRGSMNFEPNEDEDEDEFIKYWLPLFLSIHFWAGQTNPKESSKSSTEPQRGNVYEVDDLDSENPIRLFNNLSSLLSIERFNKDYSWLDIGRVIYNIYKGSEDGLNLWINLSSKSTVPGRDKNMCKLKWNELRINLLTIKTIAWYAKKDNPTGYNEWHISWCQKSFNEALSSSHTDVAKAIHRFFWLEYVYSGDTKLWYQYRKNHFYKIGTQPIPLRKDIIDRFLPVFERMRSDMASSNLDGKRVEETMDKELEFRIKAITELKKKLKNENYRSTIIKSLSDLFHIEEFERNCDKNHLLTALGNCILEVVEKRVRARDGKPEDYILKFSTIYYPFEYNWDSYWVKEVLYWFDQICVRDAGLKHYFLKRLSSFLRGLNPEKLFDVWTNSGNGGKSILTKTLQYIFGAYFVDFPTSLLMGNGKSGSGAANPELAQAANARGAILAEPDDREVMKGGIIKRITGGDRIFTRSLHENGGSMELTFKTIMVCNRIPDIANVDKALINRFVIMPFLGTWTDDAPETEEEQFRQRKFKMDSFFEVKIPDLAGALLWVMVQYYPKYAEEGLPFPDIVKEYIKKHWEDNDYYLQFIAEKIEYAFKDADKKDINTSVALTVQDLYPVFQRWFRDYYPGIMVPTAAQVKADLCMDGRLGSQPRRGQWLGVQVKQSALVPQLGLGIANI